MIEEILSKRQNEDYAELKEKEVKKLIKYYKNLITISFDSEELIKELEQDIAEFGEDKLFYAMFSIKECWIFLTSYEFIVEESPLSDEEKALCDYIVKMRAKDILELMKLQNKIIKL